MLKDYVNKLQKKEKYDINCMANINRGKKNIQEC